MQKTLKEMCHVTLDYKIILESIKGTLGEWIPNKIYDGAIGNIGKYVKFTNIEEKENIEDTIITFDIWDIAEFGPHHSSSYSMITKTIAKFKQDNKEAIEKLLKKNIK